MTPTHKAPRSSRGGCATSNTLDLNAFGDLPGAFACTRKPPEGKSLFAHDSNGKAAKAYANLAT